MIDHSRILNTLGKMALYLGNHNSICVSVSGGSDSDIMVHMIATYFKEYLHKIHFVFSNTGLEYRATLRHLDELEQKYHIRIDRVRGMSVVTAVRRFGVPVISKVKAKTISGYIRDAGPSYEKKIATTTGRYRFSDKERALANAAKSRGIRVSYKCCEVAKKEPVALFNKLVNCDLSITGERKAEGGQRALVHESCFEKNNHGLYDKYMPLFFWDDDTKQYYKESEGIKYSDCYEVWGMKRTGCVGCPFSSRAGEELRLLKKYEPNLYKACINVFGTAYRLQDEFHVNRHPILAGLEEPEQLSLFEEENNAEKED